MGEEGEKGEREGGREGIREEGRRAMEKESEEGWGEGRRARE